MGAVLLRRFPFTVEIKEIAKEALHLKPSATYLRGMASESWLGAWGGWLARELTRELLVPLGRKFVSRGPIWSHSIQHDTCDTRPWRMSPDYPRTENRFTAKHRGGLAGRLEGKPSPGLDAENLHLHK